MAAVDDMERRSRLFCREIRRDLTEQSPLRYGRSLRSNPLGSVVALLCACIWYEQIQQGVKITTNVSWAHIKRSY